MAKILVVEDDPSVRELFVRALAKAGFKAEAACDGVEAVAALEIARYALVITDLVMPRKEGIETILEIKRRWPWSKVIAVSGGGSFVGADMLEIAGSVGADATLTKPVLPADLVAAVTRVLGDGVRAA